MTKWAHTQTSEAPRLTLGEYALLTIFLLVMAWLSGLLNLHQWIDQAVEFVFPVLKH